MNNIATHLENVPKLTRHVPVVFAQLILPQFHITIASDGVDCFDVLDSKFKHVEGRVPSGPDITGHHPLRDLKLSKYGKPLW